jgi:hypothetical protein
MHGIESLPAFLNKLVEGLQCLRVQDLLRFRRRLEREEMCLETIHPVHAFSRDLAPALLRPCLADDLLGITPKNIFSRPSQRLGIATKVTPKARYGGSLARDDVGHLPITLPRTDGRQCCYQAIEEHRRLDEGRRVVGSP